MRDQDDDVIWVSDDPAVVRRFADVGKRYVEAVDLMVEECLAGWNRMPFAIERHGGVVLLGLGLREQDWTWEAWQEAQKAQQPDRAYFGSPPPDEPPPGWRKRVKDDYFSPPLKGGGSDAEFGRALLRTYSHIPNMRSPLEEYGGSLIHLSDRYFQSPGVNIKNDAVWVRCGSGYEIKDERFRRVRLSEFLAMEGK